MQNASRLAQYYQQLSAFYQQGGRRRETLEHAQTACWLAPGNPAPYQLMAEMNKPTAIKWLERYLAHVSRDRSRVPEDFWLRKRPFALLLATFCLDEGRHEDAIPHLDNSQKRDPRDLRTYRLMHRKFPEEATRRLEEYVHRQPEHASETPAVGHIEALQLLTGFYADQGRWQEIGQLKEKAEGELGVRPFVLVVGASAWLREAGNTDALAGLHARFPEILGEVPPSAQAD
jgi:tetratricopeptide (TPR) repeat protein